MRQRNYADVAPVQLTNVLPANQDFQRSMAKKSVDREAPNGDYHRGPDQRELRVQPVAAQLLFCGRRHAVAATTLARTRIAARDRGDVNLLARLVFTEPGLRQPPEQASCPRALRTAADWLSRPGPAPDPPTWRAGAVPSILSESLPQPCRHTLGTRSTPRSAAPTFVRDRARCRTRVARQTFAK